MVTLRLCSSCRRHVLGGDAACPFCGASVDGSSSRGPAYVAAAVAAAAGLAVTATTLGCVYGTPDRLDSGMRPDAASDGASPDDAATDDAAPGDDDASL